MGHDWTFQAKDARSGATHTIDRRWQQWGPATDPFHNEGGEWKGRFERAEDCDERLYLDPDGPYVLAWRIDESTSYYASDYRYYCDYMTAQQALHWFIGQRIRPPDELTAKLNIQIQKWPGDAQPESMDQREFWELGRSVSDALGELVSAICEVFDDADEFDESYLDRAQARLDRAALALLDALPQFGPTDDPFWAAWIKLPAYCDRLLDALSKVDDAAKYLVNEMGLSRARDAAFWKDAMKHLSVLHESLDNDIRWVEAYPPLNRELYWEARRNLEERQTTGLLAAVQTAPATEQPAAVETPVAQAAAVESAPDGKAAVELAVKTKPKTVGPQSETDGPVPPRSFILGDQHAELTTSQYRLVNYLWQQDGRLATKRNVSMTLWSDEEAQSTRLPSLISRTNERLSEKGIAATVEPNGDYVRLVIDRQ